MVCRHEYNTVDTSVQLVDITLHCMFVLSFRVVYYIIFIIFNDKTEHCDFELLFRNMTM